MEKWNRLCLLFPEKQGARTLCQERILSNAATLTGSEPWENTKESERKEGSAAFFFFFFLLVLSAFS